MLLDRLRSGYFRARPGKAIGPMEELNL
jgi:hypothetical protein